jgi:hypothetical protein
LSDSVCIAYGKNYTGLIPTPLGGRSDQREDAFGRRVYSIL